MSNLIVDIGNTRTKIALFEHDELLDSFHADSFSTDDLERLLVKHPNIDKAIISSVKEKQDLLISKFEKNIPFFTELTHITKLPIKNCYQTPETLGKDRIAAAVGANKKFPGKNILIIDAGTAVTYDFVTSNNEYTGGFITPGLTMRFKALNHFTDKLPLLSPEMPIEYEGINTQNSIRGGIQYGLKGEAEEMIRHFENRYEKSIIVLTGGDASYFEKLIENDNFVIPEVTLIGLNTILEFNYSLRNNPVE